MWEYFSVMRSMEASFSVTAEQAWCILGYYTRNVRSWSGSLFLWLYIVMVTGQVFCDLMQLVAKWMNAKIARASKETFLI